MNVLESAKTIDELAASLALHLKDKGVSPEYADQIAKGLVPEFVVIEAPLPRPRSLSLVLGRYAIRKDDIKLFDALTDGLRAAAGVAFFAPHQPAAAAPALAAKVAIGISIARLARALRMRGTWLDCAALHVLTVLKCNVRTPSDPGLLSADVLAIVQRTKPEADITWVQHQLDLLADVPTPDQATAALVSRDAFGRWRSHA